MSNLKQKVRDLRNNATYTEQILWQELRNKKSGVKFARQKPIILTIDNNKKLFIADFYCSKEKLAIELDGEIHNQQKTYDEIRDQLINLLGINVLRFTNDRVINNLSEVIGEIKTTISKPSSFV